MTCDSGLVSRKMTKGLFITLEGIEGVGKTTHAEFMADLFRRNGHTVTLTREPGGTATGESIRDILLHSKDQNIDPESELLLIFAARAQHIQEVIAPAISRNEIVICDRFTDATYAYQGGGRGISKEKIKLIEDWVQKGLVPDLTLLFDTSIKTGLSRAGKRSIADRFESETAVFFENVRRAYLDIATECPDRVHIIDATLSIEQVQLEIIKILEKKRLC